MSSSACEGRLIRVSDKHSFSLSALCKTLVPAICFFVLGITFLCMPFSGDKGGSQAQRNAGIIVLALAVLQFAFALLLAYFDGKRMKNLKPAQVVDSS